MTGSRRSILKTPKTNASQQSLGRSSQQSDQPENGHDAAFSSQQSLNDDRKTVSIKENPEVFYVDRTSVHSTTRKSSSRASSDDHIIQIEVSKFILHY